MSKGRLQFGAYNNEISQKLIAYKQVLKKNHYRSALCGMWMDIMKEKKNNEIYRDFTSPQKAKQKRSDCIQKTCSRHHCSRAKEDNELGEKPIT